MLPPCAILWSLTCMGITVHHAADGHFPHIISVQMRRHKECLLETTLMCNVPLKALLACRLFDATWSRSLLD